MPLTDIFQQCPCEAGAVNIYEHTCHDSNGVGRIVISLQKMRNYDFGGKKLQEVQPLACGTRAVDCHLMTLQRLQWPWSGTSGSLHICRHVIADVQALSPVLIENHFGPPDCTHRTRQRTRLDVPPFCAVRDQHLHYFSHTSAHLATAEGEGF